MVPSEQYSSTNPARQKVEAYADFYDRWILWQPQSDPSVTGAAVFSKQAPGPSQLSYFTVATMLLTLFVTPLVVWRRHRERPIVWTLIFVWFTTAYAFVASSIIEFGENQRFAFELGPLPLIASVSILSYLVRERRPPSSLNRRAAG